MPWINLADFVREVPIDLYRLLHPWYHGWDEHPEVDAMHAWRLYRRAQEPALGFLLLGDSKIRRDPTLVQAFGLMSAFGAQGLQRFRDDDNSLAAQEAREVKKVIAVLWGQGRWRRGEGPNLQTGSILSDRTWSPLLNDALILAGTHRGRQFHFADDSLEGYNFLRPAGVAGGRGELEMRIKAGDRRVAVLADRPWEVQVWQKFFLEHGDVFWNGNEKVPRVLARELIGLMTFGYQAHLLRQQLTFAPGKGGGARPDFRTYLAALREAGYFHRGEDGQRALLARISHFLFGRADALLPL